MKLPAFVTVVDKMTSALYVIVTTDHIREYLKEHDPKALEQCLDALGIDEE